MSYPYHQAYQDEMPGCSTPILAAIDPGGAIVINALDGSIRAVKAPEKEDGTMDLPAYKELLLGADMVAIERQTPRTSENVRITENSVYPNYRELMGYLQGCEIPIYPILPRAWQKVLEFPTSATLVPSMEEDGVTRYLVGPEEAKEWKILNPKQLQAERYKVWKSFLYSQALDKFPSVKKLNKYEADAWLIYRVLTKIYPLPRSKWP